MPPLDETTGQGVIKVYVFTVNIHIQPSVKHWCPVMLSWLHRVRRTSGWAGWYRRQESIFFLSFLALCLLSSLHRTWSRFPGSPGRACWEVLYVCTGYAEIISTSQSTRTQTHNIYSKHSWITNMFRHVEMITLSPSNYCKKETQRCTTTLAHIHTSLL